MRSVQGKDVNRWKKSPKYVFLQREIGTQSPGPAIHRGVQRSCRTQLCIPDSSTSSFNYLDERAYHVKQKTNASTNLKNNCSLTFKMQ